MTAEKGFEDHEVQNEITKFSPEARIAVEEARWPIFTLTGKSIRNLRQSGILTEPDEWLNQEYLETFPSRKSEVTVETLYLQNTFNKSMLEQQRVVERYSKELSTRIPDVEAVIGEASDYVEFDSLWIKRYGTHLFQYDVTLNPKLPIPRFLKRWKLFKDHIATRTVTPLNSPRGSFVALVTYFNGHIIIDGWPKEQGLHVCGVIPLIVPRT